MIPHIRLLVGASVLLAAVRLWAEPQTIEYVRDGIGYVATVYVDSSRPDIFTVPPDVQTVDYLVVGGGGGGGGLTQYGGGGGAGGFAEGALAVSGGQELSVVVGCGGAGATSLTVSENGGASWIALLGTNLVVVTGGGAGGCGEAGSVGACGGGGAKGCAGGSGTIGHSGYAGSSGGGGGGGGGMGGGGESSVTAPTIGTPGAGVFSAITGEDVEYAAGGAGGSTQGPIPVAGVDGTGNGGGGARKGQTNGLRGGSGIVVIRYARIGGRTVNGWISEPGLSETVLVEGQGASIDLGLARSGSAARSSFSEAELKTLPRGSHVMTFSVDETETWSALEKSIPFYVRSERVASPGVPDATETRYVWSGSVEGFWCDPEQWTAEESGCFGYPDSTELASVSIPVSATIRADPDEDVFGPARMKDLTVSATTTLTGGTFTVGGTLSATAGVTLLDACLDAPYRNQRLCFAGDVMVRDSALTGADAVLYAYGDGRSFVEEGERGLNALRSIRIGYFDRIRSSGFRYVVRNGVDFRPGGIVVGSIGSRDIRFVVDNASVDVSNSATVQVVAGSEESFVELRGREARLTLTKGSLVMGSEDGILQTGGLSFRLPDNPYAAAPVVKCAGAGSGQLALYGNAVIELDVTDVTRRGVYPLVEDARGAFSVGIAAAGDRAAYLAKLQSNLRVVRREKGVVSPVDGSLVTLALEGNVLSATVRLRTGLVILFADRPDNAGSVGQ